MRREYLEINGKPFIPAWVIKEHEKAWNDIREDLMKKYNLVYSAEHHGFICSNK